MALTQFSPPTGFTRKPFSDSAIGLTPQKHITGGPTTIQSLELSEGSGSNATSLKVYDNNGVYPEDLVVGTTLPDMVLKVPSSGDVEFEFSGLPFKNGLSIAGATEDGKVVTTAPAASTVCRGTVS
jgi:hypothetical protein